MSIHKNHFNKKDMGQSLFKKHSKFLICNNRGGSRTAATSEMERFLIIVKGWKPLTIITKRSILDVVAVLDSLLNKVFLL